MKDTVIAGLIGAGLLIAFWPFLPYGGMPGLIALISVLIYGELIVPFIIPGTLNLVKKIKDRPPREPKSEPAKTPAKTPAKKKTTKKTVKKTTKKKTAKKTTAKTE
jgi:hypothetical protein